MEREIKKMVVANGIPSLSQPAAATAVSATPSPNWESIDAEFRSLIRPTSLSLNSEDLAPSEAGENFGILLKAHLDSHGVTKGKVQRSGISSSMLRRTRRIERVAEHLRLTKNQSRCYMKSDPQGFHNLMRAHNQAKKVCDRIQSGRSFRASERAFKKNPWHFAKSACAQPEKSVDSLACSADDAFKYFSESFQDEGSYMGFPEWIENLMPVPSDVEVIPFDLSPITPNQIKKVLKGRPSNSSPGVDGITYHHLKNLPSAQHFLATLFSKILLQSQDPPSSWRLAKFITIHKKGVTTDPGNFRPIALTSVIAKLFHKIIAIRLEEYLISNNFLDTSLQKGFLRGINGCMEHIFAIQTILCNAKDHSLPIYMSFIDLRNAFGSVAHSYIYDMLNHIKLPIEISSYISRLYSSLSGFVSTKDWSTPVFDIKRGVFQGDTLSPLLFLIAFNPIILSISSHPSSGYRLQLGNVLNNEAQITPAIDTFIYALWDVRDSREKAGWYLAKVVGFEENGETRIRYRSGGLEECVQLLNIKWAPAKGNGKWVLPPESDLPLPSGSARAERTSREHKVKGYADDLTILSSSKSDHQAVLNHADERCKEICLFIRPDKCFSYVFDGKNVKGKTTFSIGGGVTKNIKENPTKFLGSRVCSSQRAAKKVAGKEFHQHFSKCINRLNTSHIRGEYKVWIYKRYLVPSLQFKLAVDGLPVTIIKKSNALASKFIKSWLGLTRSTTVAVIHHPSILNIPFLEDYSSKAKLSFLAAVTISKDPLIEEISDLALSLSFRSAQGIRDCVGDALSLAISSVESINRKTLQRALRVEMVERSENKWNKKLSDLSVQCKFKEVCTLEEENRVWKRIMDGLPAGQLSFILRAASDTLPTPVNLKRWKIRIDATCSLCGSPSATTHHVLNGCHEALTQGRYTWRHDSVLLKLVSFIKPSLPPEAKIYSDLTGFRACDNPPSTIPPDLIVTSARPDIVILREKEVLLLELTVPHNSLDSISNAHRRKEGKENYCSLLSDLEAKRFSAAYQAIEIGSLGHSLPRSLKTLRRHLPYIPKPDLQSMFDSAAKVAIAASYNIFLARREHSWNSNRSLLQ